MNHILGFSQLQYECQKTYHNTVYGEQAITSKKYYYIIMELSHSQKEDKQIIMAQAATIKELEILLKKI